MAWKPESDGSANGSRNEVTRSMRYGATATMRATAATPAAKNPANQRRGRPPAHSRPTSTRPRLTTPPKSGSRMSRSDRTANTGSSGTSSVLTVRKRSRTARMCAPHSANTSLASSEGWKLVKPRSIQARDPLSSIPMPGTSTATSRTAATTSPTGAQRRTSPTGSRTATSSATRPMTAKTTWSTPGRQAGWSSSAASMAEAEKTMTRPMARSMPAAPTTSWKLVMGPSSQAGGANRRTGVRRPVPPVRRRAGAVGTPVDSIRPSSPLGPVPRRTVRACRSGRSPVTASSRGLVGTGTGAAESPVGPSARSQARDGEPVGVEQAQPEGDRHPGHQPEADDHRVLGPAGQLEVVVQRGHPEHPAAGGAEEGHLDDHRERDRDEQPAEHDEQQLGAGDDGEAGEQPAEGQRAGVAHEDPRGAGVPPQEAQAGAQPGGRHQRDVQRVADDVAALDQLAGAVVGELPERDDRVGAADHRRAARRQPVEAVGEVDRVGEPGDEQVREDHEADRAQEQRGDVADVGDELRGRGDAGLVREVQRQDGEGDAHDQLADQLGGLVQPEAAPEADLEVVVEEADGAQAHHEEQHQQATGGRTAVGLVEQEQVGDAVTTDRGPDDDGAAHGGRALLRQVALRTVVPDLLAEALAAEQVDGDRRGQDRDDQPERGRDEDRPHVPAPAARRSAASTSSP